MKIVCIKMPEKLVEIIDVLIMRGVARSRSELVRRAVQEYIRKQLVGSEHGDRDR